MEDTGARYVVVSTQGRGDEAALLAALAVDADYVAFVGSRKKAEALRATLAKRGVAAERLAKLKAPAGLDLGAITPDEIAISILAEIVANSAGRSAVSKVSEKEWWRAFSSVCTGSAPNFWYSWK